MKAPRESDLLRACRQLLELRGWVVYRVNSGALPLESGGKRRYVRFGTPGMADLLALREGLCREPAVLWVETKGPTGTQRASQRAFEKQVKACGCNYLLVRDLRELEAFLEANE